MFVFPLGIGGECSETVQMAQRSPPAPGQKAELGLGRRKSMADSCRHTEMRFQTAQCSACQIWL
ncbi:hypothetical protein ACRRTK_021257 [Alexandromys fortis]